MPDNTNELTLEQREAIARVVAEMVPAPVPLTGVEVMIRSGPEVVIRMGPGVGTGSALASMAAAPCPCKCPSDEELTPEAADALARALESSDQSRDQVLQEAWKHALSAGVIHVAAKLKGSGGSSGTEGAS